MAIFQKQFTICYSHLDQFRRVKLTSLLDFLQDAATAHSDSLGMTLENLKKEGAFWVLISLEITIHALPKIDEQITVETWSRGIRTVYGYRDFRILNGAGQVLLTASSIWVYMGGRPLHPLRVPADKAALFGTTGESLSRRHSSLPFPNCTTPAFSYTILRHDIDTNQHVNNVKYMEIALEALPSFLWESTPKHIELQFIHAAVWDTTLDVYIEYSPTFALCELRSPTMEKPSALIRFTYHK